jgi:MFS family permease
VLFWCGFAMRLIAAREPLVTLDILRNQVILAGTVTMFFAQAVNVGMAVYLPIYLQSALGLSASESGTALLGLLLGTVAGAMTSGKIIPHFTHYRRIAVFGSLLCVVSLAALGLMADGASLALVEVLTTLSGIGVGAVFPVMTVSVQNAVTRANLGVATGVLTFLRSLGGALGVALLGTIALSYGLPLAGDTAPAAAGSQTAVPFAMVFLTSAILSVITFALILAMPEKPLRSRFDDEAPIMAE